MNHFPLYWAIYSIVTNNQLGDPSGSMTSEKAVFCQKKAGICERIQNVFFYHQLAACLASSLGSSLHHNDWKSTKLVHFCNYLLCAGRPTCTRPHCTAAQCSPGQEGLPQGLKLCSACFKAAARSESLLGNMQASRALWKSSIPTLNIAKNENAVQVTL